MSYREPNGKHIVLRIVAGERDLQGTKLGIDNYDHSFEAPYLMLRALLPASERIKFDAFLVALESVAWDYGYGAGLVAKEQKA